MKPEHQQRLVQILVEPGPGGAPYAVATGFAITTSRVLTCAHALEGYKTVKVRFLGAAVRDEWLDATVLWPKPICADEVDTAVLEIDPRRVEEIQGCKPGRVLGGATLADRKEWVSRGVLRAAVRRDEEGRPLSEAADFGGKLYLPNERGVMTLDVDSPPKDANDWQGGSGSPVMVSDRLIGIVTSWPSAWDGKTLHAISVGYLWALPGFCEAVGLPREGEELDRLRSEIVCLLDRDSSRVLREELGRTLRLPGGDARAVATHLTGLSALRLLRRANHVLGGFLGDRPGDGSIVSIPSAKILESIVDRLLPWGTEPGVAADIRQLEQGASLVCIDIPCGTTSVAELHMARADGRKAAFGSLPLDGTSPVGTSCAPHSPAVGFGVNPEPRLRQLLCDLGNAYGVPLHAMRDAPLETIAVPVQAALRELAEPEPGLGEPLRSYLLYFKDEDEKVAMRLKHLLPALRICRFKPDDIGAEESQLCVQLRNYALLKTKLGTA